MTLIFYSPVIISNTDDLYVNTYYYYYYYLYSKPLRYLPIIIVINSDDLCVILLRLLYHVSIVSFKVLLRFPSCH